MGAPKHNPGTPANQARVRQSILHSTFDALNQRTAGIEHFPGFLEECFEERIWEKERTFESGRMCPPISFHEFVHEHFPVGLGSSYEAIEKVIDGNPKLTTAWEKLSGRKNFQVTEIAIGVIRIDGGTQSRACLNQETVEAYAEKAKEGAQLPPVVVFFDGESYWLADGFHRRAAASAAGKETVVCNVRQGTRRDAILFSVGANDAHGLRRTNADKRRAVEMLLSDEEWSTNSDRWIAEKCGVHSETVGVYRKQLPGSGSSREPRVGQDGKVRKLPEPKPRRVAETQTPSARSESTTAANDFAASIGAIDATPAKALAGALEPKPAPVVAMKPAETPSYAAQDPDEQEPDDEADVAPEPGPESVKLYRYATELMRPFTGQQLAEFESVLVQLLTRVQESMGEVFDD